MVYGVIFDCDGVVSNSWPLIKRFQRHLCTKYGKSMPKNIKLRNFKINPPYAFPNNSEYADYFRQGENVYDLMGFNWAEDKELIWNEFIKYLSVHRPKIFPFVKRNFQTLKKGGIRTGLATDNSIILIEPFLQSNGLQELLDAVATRDDNQKSKPYPDLLLKCSEKMGVPAKNCIYCGDEIADIFAARYGGMLAIGTGYGLTPPNVMLKLVNKSQFARTPMELGDIIMRNLAQLKKMNSAEH